MNNGYVDVTGIDDNNDVEQNGNANLDKEEPSMNKHVTIDRIRDERTNEETGEHEYLVKFKPIKETWVNSAEIEIFPELIQNYQKRKENAPVYIDEEEQEEENESVGVESVDNRRHSERQRAPTKRYVDEKMKKKKLSPRRKVSQSKSMQSMANQENSDDEGSDSDREYTAEKILEKKSKNGVEKYLVKWKGYGPKWNTWEPRKGIEHLKVFKEYEKEMQQKDEDDGEEDEEFTIEHVLERKVYKDGKIMYFIKWQGFDENWNSWEPRESLIHLDVVKAYENENPLEQKTEAESVSAGKAKRGGKSKGNRSAGKQDEASTPSTSKKPRIEEAEVTQEKDKKKKRRRHRY